LFPSSHSPFQPFFLSFHSFFSFLLSTTDKVFLRLILEKWVERQKKKQRITTDEGMRERAKVGGYHLRVRHGKEEEEQSSQDVPDQSRYVVRAKSKRQQPKDDGEDQQSLACESPCDDDSSADDEDDDIENRLLSEREPIPKAKQSLPAARVFNADGFVAVHDIERRESGFVAAAGVSGDGDDQTEEQRVQEGESWVGKIYNVCDPDRSSLMMLNAICSCICCSHCDYGVIIS